MHQITRSIVMEDYRTIGVKGHSYNELTLNQSDYGKQENFGDIVSLIGINNSGKSNAVEGIKTFGKGEASSKDSPSFVYGGLEPNIYLKILDHKNNIAYVYYIGEKIPYISNNLKEDFSSKKNHVQDYIFKKQEEVIKLFTGVKRVQKSELENGEITEFKNYISNILVKHELMIEELINEIENKNMTLWNSSDDLTRRYQQFEGDKAKLFDKLRNNKTFNLSELQSELKGFEAHKSNGENYYYDEEEESFDTILSELSSINIKDFLKEIKDYDLESILEEYGEYLKKIYHENNIGKVKEMSHYIFNVPKIINFDSLVSFGSEEFILSDLNLTNIQESLNSNNIFKVIMGLTDVTSENFYRAYERDIQIRGAIDDLEDEINEKLQSIGEKFNKLYFKEDVLKKGYSFKIKTEHDRISLRLLEDNKALNLEEQSTGFRWFFDFFFNVLSNYELSKGDIIVMDEPATSLHKNSQKELRSFMKKFAIENNVTIVYSTHLDNLLDLGCLDEIRIITKSDRKTEIYNKFIHSNSEHKEDTLKKIEEAFSTDRYYFMKEPYSNVVYVEGITDYNYLNCVPNKVNFIPINGLKHSNKKLISLLNKTPNSKILIDSDSQGEKTKQYLLKEGVPEERILEIKNIVEGAFIIEDLFTEEERKEYSLDKKKYYKSVNIKNLINTGKFQLDSETEERIKQVIEVCED